MPGARKTIIAACCLALLWLGGCAQRSKAPPAPEQSRPIILQPGQPQAPNRIGPVLPAWVMKGSGAYEEGTERFFYGVGSATTASGNRILARTAADNLARGELGKVLRRYLSVLADHRVDDALLDQLLQEGLRKAVVTEHWIDPRDGGMYALCRLDLKQFKETLARNSALEMSIRNAWIGMADRQHARMADLP
jgi:hypothetical protein